MSSEFGDSYRAQLEKNVLYRCRPTAEDVLLDIFKADVRYWQDLEDVSISITKGRYGFKCDDTFIGGFIKDVEVPDGAKEAYLLWGYFWEYGAWDGEVIGAYTDIESARKEIKRIYDSFMGSKKDWQEKEIDEDSCYLDSEDHEVYEYYITRVQII